MSNWPVLHIRISDGVPMVTGPAHAAFGNTNTVSPKETVSADPSAHWEWDGVRLRAWTDRYGFFPVFYEADQNHIRISPSLVALLDAGASRELDYTALGVLFRLGYLVGEDTPFRNIRILPPHGQLTWEGGRLQVTGSLITAQLRNCTRDAALDGYIDVFHAAIRRRPSDGYSIMPLSGGRDSRHIFLELVKAGMTPDIAVTIAPLPAYATNEVEMARRVAERAGVRHVSVPAPDPQWPAETKTRSDTHFSTVEHWWLQALVDYIAAAPRTAGISTTVSSGSGSQGRTVYEGIAGDLLSTYILKTPERKRMYAEGHFAALADTFLAPDEGYLPTLLPKEVYQQISRESARDRVAQELALHADQPDPMTSFLFYNRARRVTGLSPTSLLSPHATVWCPYLDTDVFDFLISLPSDLMKGATDPEFHDMAIHRAHPRFADIPFASKTTFARQTAWGYQWSLVRDMTSALLRDSPWLIRPSVLFPRLAMAAISTNYWTELFHISSMVNYLHELSRQSPAPLVPSKDSHKF